MTTNKRPELRQRPVRPQPRSLGEGARLPRLTFDECSKKYDEYLDLLHQDGIIIAAHRNADGWMAVWEQAWRDISNDPENLVAIITNAGDGWIGQPMPFCEGKFNYPLEYVNQYDHIVKSLEGLAFSLNLPTIGVINGQSVPGDHFELALACDITLSSDDVVIRDIHREVGTAPGDGTYLMLEHLMGPKRAAYHASTAMALMLRPRSHTASPTRRCPRTGS